MVGMELWRPRETSIDEVERAKRKMGKVQEVVKGEEQGKGEPMAGVLKARLDQRECGSVVGGEVERVAVQL